MTMNPRSHPFDIFVALHAGAIGAKRILEKERKEQMRISELELETRKRMRKAKQKELREEEERERREIEMGITPNKNEVERLSRLKRESQNADNNDKYLDASEAGNSVSPTDMAETVEKTKRKSQQIERMRAAGTATEHTAREMVLAAAEAAKQEIKMVKNKETGELERAYLIDGRLECVMNGTADMERAYLIGGRLECVMNVDDTGELRTQTVNTSQSFGIEFQLIST
jgi:hypothetical protein